MRKTVEKINMSHKNHLLFSNSFERERNGHFNIVNEIELLRRQSRRENQKKIIPQIDDLIIVKA